jgi:hypothetical protein
MEGQDTMTSDPVKSEGDSEVFRFGGFGTILLLSLLAFIGLYPLLLGDVAGRLVGGLILAVILVSSAVTATRSRTHRVTGITLAILLLGKSAGWKATTKSSRPSPRAFWQYFFFIRRC